MLTVTEARHLLGAHCPMTDEEIAAMIDQLRLIALVALDAVEADRGFSASEPRVSEP